MKKQTMYDLFNFNTESRELLSLFAPRAVWTCCSNHEQSLACGVLRRSRFALVPSHIASRLTGLPFCEPAVILIFRNKEEVQVAVADSNGVLFRRLDTLTYDQYMSTMRHLDCGIIPPSVIPSEGENQKREFILKYLEKQADENAFFVA